MSSLFFNRISWVMPIFIGIAISFIISHAAGQETMIWLGPPDEVGDWYEPLNWLNPAPEEFYDFVIDNGGIAQIENGSASGTRGVVGDLYAGSLIQTGGLLVLESSLRLGNDFGSFGRYELAGGEATLSLKVGAVGDGEFIFSGGLLNTSDIHIGVHSTNEGTIYHSGGLLQGTPGDISPEIRMGSDSGGVGTYYLSGSGQIDIPKIRITNGSFFQSGGLLDIHDELRLSGHASTATLFHLEVEESKFSARSIFIDGYDDPIHTQFQQNGGNVEASYVYVSHGFYQIDDGLLATTNLNVGGGASVYRPQAEGHFTQSGGHVVVNGELKVSGSSSSGRTSSGQYEMLGGTLEVNRIWISSEHEAIFHQTGGDVRVDFLEIEGDINRALQSVYKMEGGTLHVAKQLVVAESDNYHIGGFDFSGQPVTVSTGEQSFVKIGANATFESAENATLQIGPNSIMTIPESLDLGAIFGTYERNDAIYYHEGQPVYVGPGERAQIAGWDLFHDGFVVDGLVYDDPSRGAADVQGPLQVNLGGCVELKSTSSWWVPGASDGGVFGGSATVGHLELDTSSSKPILFRVDNDGILVSKDVILLEGHADSCILRLDSGRIDAREIQVLSSGACYQQNGGNASVDKMTLIPHGVVEINAGILHVGLLEIASLSQLYQNGGAVEADRLCIYESEYIMDGGALHILGDLSARYNCPDNKPEINLSNSAAVVRVEGAILHMKSTQPFINAGNATLDVDENSLVIVPAGANLQTVFGTFRNEGLMHIAGQPLTIAADREIHGLGDLSSSAPQIDVFGKLIADDGLYGISLARFHVHPGAIVDLGNGGCSSGTLAPDHRSRISGGILRASYLSISGGLLGEFLHTGGDATIGKISFGSDTTYRLTGGSLTIGRDLTYGRIDFDHSSAQLRLADRAYMELDKIVIRDHDNASFVAGTNSLLVIAPGFDPDAEFASFSSAGIVHVRGETLIVPEGHTITGAIELPDPVINHGSIEPGFSIGEMRVYGDYIQESTGTLVIEIGDHPSQDGFDQLGIGGDAWLDGQLEVRLIDGFIPFVGLTYPILTAVDIHGTFADGLSTVDVLGGGTFSVVYEGNEVLLTNYHGEVLLDLPGDFDIDGDVDAEDLLVWKDHFGLPGPHNDGDADGDNDVDGEDFLLWQRHYGTSSGETGVSNAVPEPTGIMLLAILIMLLSGRLFKSQRAAHGIRWVLTLALLLGIGPHWITIALTKGADTVWMNPGIGDWDDPVNWSNGIPIPGTFAVIDNGGTAQIITDGDISDRPDHTWIGRNNSGTLEHLAGNRILGSITLAQNVGSTGTLIFGGDAIGQYAAIQKGRGTGSVMITGGMLNVNTFYADQNMPCYHSGGTVVIEYMYRLFGRYELSGSAHLQIDEYETRFDHGELIQSGGHLDISWVDFDHGAVYRMQNGSATIARAAVRDGLIELSGGELDLGNLILSPPGLFQAGGNMVVRGGTLILSDSMEPGATPITFEPGYWTIDTRGGIANYSTSIMPDVTHASLTSSVDTITLLPPGMDTSLFRTFTPQGIVHVVGSPLTIPRPARITGTADFTDHLIVDGVLIAGNAIDDHGAIHARDGMEVHGTAFVNLADGSLTVNDDTSGIFGGALRANHLDIGLGASGRFKQEGGSFADGDSCAGPIIHVGKGIGGDGYYELAGGRIEAEDLRIAWDGAVGYFNHIAGSIGVGALYVGEHGTYELSTGRADENALDVDGVFIQSGGEHSIRGRLGLGQHFESHGTYVIDGSGRVTADLLHIGYTGGLDTGFRYGDGRFEIRGGSVVFDDILVGDGVAGNNELLILSNEAHVEVRESLLLGPTASLTAVPGAAIRMPGADFEIISTQSEQLRGLNHLTLLFEGGDSAVSSLEVASQDLGPVLAGFTENFSLGSLVVGGDTVGCVTLQNAVENTTGSEAVYTGQICIGPDSILDLNGFTVYYRQLSVDSTATVVLSGGQLIHVVPEPHGCVLAVLVVLALLIPLGRKSNRQRAGLLGIF